MEYSLFLEKSSIGEFKIHLYIIIIKRYTLKIVGIS